MKICPRCGATYPVTDGFCPMDGVALVADALPDAPSSGATLGAAVEDPWLGRILDRRYRLDEQIGSGGMGIVYRATHVAIEKRVAVKVLRDDHFAQAEIMKRFVLEARLASSIKHPNVVEIMDFGELAGGAAYYVMELLDGHSLATEIDDNGRLDPARAVRIAIQIARGLGSAHAAGVVHRDLKPDNVFVCPAIEADEIAKILDFGIARVVGRKTRLTKMGAVVGTPEYMSPEQAQGEDVDPRSDYYSLGIILFEMLTGQVPFRGDTVVSTLTKQMFDVPPLLHDVAPGLPPMPKLQWVLHSLLAKSREDRPDSQQGLLHVLSTALDEDFAADGASKRTVALGSGSIADPHKATGPFARFGVRKWDGLSVPVVSSTSAKPARVESDASPRPEWSVPPGTTSPREHDVTDDPRGIRRPNLPLLTAVAAVFAALVTFAIVRALNRGTADSSVSPAQDPPPAAPARAEIVRPSPTPPAPASPAADVGGSALTRTQPPAISPSPPTGDPLEQSASLPTPTSSKSNATSAGRSRARPKSASTRSTPTRKTKAADVDISQPGAPAHAKPRKPNHNERPSEATEHASTSDLKDPFASK